MTDDKYDGELPQNVELIELPFAKFRDTVQNRFDFQISLKTPYKLCDYKPTYGYVFYNLLEDCKYWGYCDMDITFGNLKSFLPQNEYDKISFLGHFCLYKNQPNINTLFMSKQYSKINYEDILSSDMHFGFDEIGEYGINNIFQNEGCTIFNYEKYVADISCARDGMTLAVFEDNHFYPLFGKRIFAFEKGHIFAYELLEANICKKEYAYVHLQKRNMNNLLGNTQPNSFLILPDKYCDYQSVTDSLIINSQDNHFLPLKLIKVKSKSVIKRYKRRRVIKKIISSKRFE